MGSKLRKLIRYLIRIGLLLAFCVVGLLGLGYWQRTAIADWLGERTIADLGLETADFQVAELGVGEARLEQIHFANEGWGVKSPAVIVEYSLSELWSGQNLKRIYVPEMSLSVDAGLLAISTEEGKPTVDSNDRLKALFPLLVDEVSVGALTLDVVRDDIGETVVGSFSLKDGLSESIETKLHLKGFGYSFDLKGSVDSENYFFDVTGEAKINEPLVLLDRWYPQWDDDQFFETASLGEIESTFALRFDLSGVKKVEGSVRFVRGSFEMEDTVVSTDWVEARFEMRENDSILVHGEGILDGAMLSGVNLQQSSFSYELRGRDFAMEIDETDWIYDDDTGGKASGWVKGKIADKYQKSAISFGVKASEQVVSGHSLRSLDISGEGTLEQLTGAVSTIQLVDYPFAMIEDAMYSVSGLLEDVKTVTYAGLLDWEDEALSPIQLSNGSVSGEAVLEEDEIRWSTSLKAIETILAREEESTIEGDFSCASEGVYYSEHELIDCEFRFSGPSLKGEWDGFRLDSVNMEGNVDIEGLNTDKASLVLESGLGGITDYLGPLTTARVEVLGSELSAPEVGSMKWFSLELEKSERPIVSGKSEFVYALNSGIVEYPPEALQQLTVEGSILTKNGVFEYTSLSTGLFEGESVAARSSGAIDLSASEMIVKGIFTVDPVSFLSSDVVSRHEPSLTGVSFSGKATVGGSYWLDSKGMDASVRMKVDTGKLVYPEQDLVADGVFIISDMASLRKMKSSGSQAVEIGEVRFGDLQGTDLKASFSLDGLEKLTLIETELGLFDGTVSLEPLELSLLDLDADLRVKFAALSVAPIMEKIDFFDGVVTGKVSGSLPIGLRSGAIEIGEGFLELVEGSDSRLRYNAEGLFEEEPPPKGFYRKMVQKAVDELGLNSNDIVEDSLADLPIDHLRIDLFDKNFPGTPIRARVVGVADTGKVKAPLDIAINVNGSLEELLNFLLRMGSL